MSAPGTAPATEHTKAAGQGGPRSPAWKLLERVSIRSKLLLMLLAMAVLATAIAGGIGFQSGRASLRAAVFERLTATREAQSRALETGVADILGSLVVFAKGDTAPAALQGFTAGFDKLAAAPVTPAEQKALAAYYDAKFSGADGGDLDVNALLPTSNAARYLQSRYTVPAGDREQALAKADAGDGSEWSATSARFNDYFREIVTRLKIHDLLLLDARGNVVYSAAKGVQLGTNVLTGPYRGEGDLPDAFRKAMVSNDVDYVGVTDFAEYLPTGDPTGWMLTPIGPPGRAAGVMVLEFSIDIINRIMTANQQWDRSGMGRTGETYLVGRDGLMRSDSRLFLEDRDAYRQQTVAAGTPLPVAERAINQGTTVLVQPVGTSATEAAQRGETGTLIATDYLGRRALQAYAPQGEHLPYVIIASIDSTEAFAPERNFTQKLVRSTTAIILVACLAAMWWSRLFLRPIKRLEEGAEQISAGKYDFALPVPSKDEFGDLTAAFNEMSRNLSIKQQLLDDQRSENERLLRSLMPESVVARYRDGEETIAQEHQDVTVVFADLIGLDELSADLPAEESLAIINKLARQFDAAAESFGVERVRNTHNGYLASCGLTVPRLDNIHRSVNFALEMQRIVDRLNTESDLHLQLRAGIDAGTAASGLVGRAGLVYDLWGGAVQLAASVRHGVTEPGVYVTDEVYQATRDSFRYTPAGTVAVGDREEQVWRLAEEQS